MGSTQRHLLRAHWGYFMMYAQQPFHHADYSWDGGIYVTGGRVIRTSMLRIRGPWALPTREQALPLPTPVWHWQADSARYRLGGVQFEIEGEPDTVIEVRTRSVTARFSVAQILEERVLRWPVGPRYSCVELTVLLDGHDPNLDRPDDIMAMVQADGRWRALIHARSINGPAHRWNRTDWVWIAPGHSAEMLISEPGWNAHGPAVAKGLRVTFHCAAAVPSAVNQPPEEVDENGRNTSLQYRVYLNDDLVSEGWQPFWEQYLHPMIEEIVVELPQDLFRPGQNSVRLQSDSGQRDYLLLARVGLEEVEYPDLQVVICPRWALMGEEFEIVLVSRREQDEFRVELPSGLRLLDEAPDSLWPGEYRLRLRAEQPLASATMRFSTQVASCEAVIDQIVDVEDDATFMRVGMETLALPWRSPGYVEQCLRFLAESRLGDYSVFRHVRDENHAAALGTLCRTLGIYFMMAHSVPPRWALAARRTGGPYFCGWLLTELDGPLFGYELEPVHQETPEPNRTMRTACEAYLAFRRNLLDRVKTRDPSAATVDMITIPCHSYSYAAGADLCTAQLNKMHNVLLLADAKGAARAYGRSVWCTYIAEGAHKHPEGEEMLRMWWLAIHLAYICGSSFVNDEESMLRNYHERLYSFTDRFPRLRQEILREFYRFVRTHPRRGELLVTHGLLSGRYACDLADGLSDSRKQRVAPMVWRFCGANTPEWRPGTPEYGLRYLDVFFPGVWLHTLVQSPERVRRWYSGTPYGELEIIPAGAAAATWSNYRLLLLLGWNTMDEELYERMGEYVENGGTLFLSIPHLTTNESREFLVSGMEPLNLLRDGDFSGFLGLRAKGKAERISSIAVLDIPDSPLPHGRVYSLDEEDGPAVEPRHPPVHLEAVDLCGAEPVAKDAATEAPVVVRHRHGRGTVYVLLTHDYPGNSWLYPMVTDLVHGLAQSVRPEVEVDDASGDIYYTVRRTTDHVMTVHLLNTDWTEQKNVRECRLRIGDEWVPLAIREGRLTTVVATEGLTILVEDPRVHIEVTGSEAPAGIRLHGFGDVTIGLRRPGGQPLGPARFQDEPVLLEAGDPWSIARLSFSEVTVGDLSVSEA